MLERLNIKTVNTSLLLWAILFILIPIIMVFSSMKAEHGFTIFQLFLRTYWIPAVIFEIFTVIMALHFDWKPWQQFQLLSRIIKSAICVWVISIFISAFFSSLSPVALIYSFLWLLHLGFFGAILHLLSIWNRNIETTRILALIFPIGSAISAILVASYSFYIGHDVIYDWVSDMPGFSNIRHIGYLLLLGSAISLGAIISNYDKLLHFSLATINIALIIWFGSRGPLLAILVAFTVAFIILPAFRKIDKLLIIAAILVLASIASQIIPTPPSGSYNILNRVDSAQIEKSIASDKNIDTISSGRLVMWKDAAQMIMQNPIGYGSDQFKYSAKSAKGASRHPHNLLLQIFFEWGLIGGTAFLFLVAVIIRKITIDFIADRSKAVFILPTIAASIFALMDGLLFYALPIALLCLLIALQIHKPAQNI